MIEVSGNHFVDPRVSEYLDRALSDFIRCQLCTSSDYEIEIAVQKSIKKMHESNYKYASRGMILTALKIATNDIEKLEKMNNLQCFGSGI
jgi:hypothetical protein